MITFAVESLEENIPYLQHLLPEHYKELALNQDKVPLVPRYDIYINRERAGEIIFVTARESGIIVGYFIGFIQPGLHYATCLTCNMDIFYIRKDLRKGRLGIKLFQYVEKELRRRGVDRWFVGTKLHADASSLFKYLKFEPVEIYYTKWIGE
jgi:N-acetylglutamate synthase-like GNAT family acetyltransferase